MSAWKLVTLRLQADVSGDYEMPSGSLGGYCGSHWLEPGAHIVKVEDAPRELPTEQGALILARVGGDPAVLILAFHDGEPTWFYSGSIELGPVMVSEIGDDWVQIDPETLRPIEDPT